MSPKENPGVQSPRIIDDESINRNVIGINSLSAKSQYTIGKSSPMLTIDNTINSASSDKDEIQKMLPEFGITDKEYKDDKANNDKQFIHSLNLNILKRYFNINIDNIKTIDDIIKYKSVFDNFTAFEDFYQLKK